LLSIAQEVQLSTSKPATSQPSSNRQDWPQGHLFEMALDPMLVADEQGHLIDVNPAACQFLNLSSLQLVGRPLSQICQSDPAHSLCPAHWPQADEMGPTMVQGEIALQLWNGAQRIVTYRASFWGQPCRQFLILRDLTSQKQTEAKCQQLHQQLESQVAQHSQETSQMGQDLALNEARLRAIFNQAAIGINQAAPNGYFIQANQTFCQMLGYSEAELLSLRFQDVEHPDDTAATEAALQQLYGGEQSSITLEKRYIRKDGTVLWTNTVLSILRDEDGQPISDIAIVEDITRRKQVEQVLNDERNLFISGPTMVFKWSPDPGWPILYVSPNVEAQLGYAPATLTARTVTFRQLMHPDDCDRIRSEIDDYTATKTQYYAQEYRLRHANGEYRWFDDFTHAIYDAQGEVVQFLGYVQDITDRKQIDLALQQSETTKQAMLEAIPDLLLRINRQGIRHDFISGGEVTVCSAVDSQRPQSIYDTLPKALADQRLHVLAQALDTGERQQYEHTITIGGKQHYEETRIVPLDTDEALVMVRDVTDRVTAEQALRESQQRFQAIFDQMYQFIGLLTPDGILLEANQTALNFGGFAREEVVGQPFWEGGWWKFSTETQVQLRQAIAAAAQGEFIRYEVKVQGKDQQVILIDFSLRPVFDEQGQVVLLIPEGRDITQRKQIELELERTKIFLEQTNTVARVGGWEVDLVQNVIHWTRITREIHEVGAEFEPTIETGLQFYSEGDNQRIATAIEQARQTGQSWDEKLQIRTFKGNLRWVRVLGQTEFVAGRCVRLYGAFQDIDAQMRAEVKLQELTQQLQQAQHMAQLGNWWFDLKTGELYWSAEIFRLLGVDQTETPFKLEDRPELVHPDDLPRWQAHLQTVQQQGTPHEMDMRVIWPGGEIRYVHVRTYANRQEDPPLNLDEPYLRLFGTFLDVTDRKQAAIRQEELLQQLQQANQELNRLAMVDGLTQVANRRQFDQVLAQEWDRAKRDRTFLTLILSDIDFFKPYNDNYGHPAGDRCLCQVADILSQVTQRSGDLVARYGGEEFGLVLPDTQIHGAIAVVESIRAAIAAAHLPHEFSKISDQITLSLGVVCCIPQDQHSPSQLIDWADTALYNAKAKGRNTYHLGTTAIKTINAQPLTH
jgi:diguanylate cyclase (GGDEF)-like protein/PAS domain S-box-containing protein